MQSSESLDDREEDEPDICLVEEGLLLLVDYDLLEQVAAVRVLHHDAERVGVVVDEALAVGDHEGASDRSQNAHLAQGVLLLFVGQVLEANLLEGVDIAVALADDLVDVRVGTLAQPTLDLEIF